MHHYGWGLFLFYMLATLTAASPIDSTRTTTINSSPDLVKRADPSPYPYGNELTNEMRWEGWNPKDTGTERDEARKIHDAYDTMKELVVLAWREADAKTPTFKRWFAESDADNVKNVLGRIVDMSLSTPQFQPRMKDRVLVRSDFGNICTGDGGENAYTEPKSGRHHMCAFGLAKPNLASMTCNDLLASKRGNGENKVSSKRSRTVSGILLHETVHWAQIGDVALGKHITDLKSGANSYDCFAFSPADKLINAQNYAFFATEAYFQSKKGCNFVNPPFNTKELEDAADKEPNGATKSISIIYRSFVKETYSENDWFVYETPVGVSAICRPADQTVAKWPAADGPGPTSPGPDWPNGTFDINVDKMKCKYMNNNQNPGALWCDGRRDPIPCFKDPALDKRQGKYCDGTRNYQQPYVNCKW